MKGKAVDPTVALVYLNGRYLPARRAHLSAFDRGFLYADGLFETLRIYGGAPFALDAHLARLARSARWLGLPLPTVRWRAVLARLARGTRWRGRDAAARITVTRGTGSGLEPPATGRPTVLVWLRPLDPAVGTAQRRGVAVTCVPFRRASVESSHKTLNYVPAILARAVARRRKVFEALYTAADGSLLEGTTTNLFLVRGEDLVTPPLTAGLLPGVTRALVLGLGRSVGLRPRERRVRRLDLLAADEAFLTASTLEIAPVVALDGRRVGRGRPGPATRALQAAYARMVRQSLAASSVARRVPAC